MNGYQLRVLESELTSDPLGRGYTGMTDQQVSDDLNNSYRPAPDVEKLSSGEIYDAVDQMEYALLGASEQAQVDTIFGLGESVLVGPSSKARATMLSIFSAGSNTRADLIALVTNQTQTRASEIGLSGVTVSHIASVRA